MTRIMFVTSEAHPLIKTGGLGDVSGSLPAALESLHHDVRLVLPAYQSVLEKLTDVRSIASLRLSAPFSSVRILEAVMPDTQVKLWLIDAPECFNRAGNPYQGPDGQDWSDNAFRFTLFARAVVELAMGRGGLDWKPEIVHCNDWQTGLVPALLSQESGRPGTVFTIHNLAYQGLFPYETFERLQLPPDLWSLEAMEFYDSFSFIKGGLAFADYLTTVSPTYALEIRRPQLGYGLHGLLNHRSRHLVGILNGADYAIWDPSNDRLIPKSYSSQTLNRKCANKKALQARFNLPQDPRIPVIGLVGRLVEQKGIDLVLEALPDLLERPVQVAILGSGERRFEQALCDLAEAYPRQIGMFIGYCENRAHLVEAGADMFLMPSRFEPCGLNQLYSLRYGTVPIVRHTGGLADTVIDAVPGTLADGSATGFVFEKPAAEALLQAVNRALDCLAKPATWRQLARTGMDQDFSWQASARRYTEVYEKALRLSLAA